MSYCPACVTPRECDANGCARREACAPADLFGQCITRYTVEGKGAFPIDMLRIDAAWPATRYAGARLVNTFGAKDDEKHSVELQSLRAPNFRAWLAASWHVREINGVQL